MAGCFEHRFRAQVCQVDVVAGCKLGAALVEAAIPPLLIQATVSSSDSRSSGDMTTATGCPWRVMVTRSCVRATESTTSER